MNTESNTQLPALQPPDISHSIRQVRLSDLDALRQECWAHRPVNLCQELLKRIKQAKTRKRGVGILVTPSDQSKIIAYGQIMMLSKCSEISDLVVAEAYRSQGIGTAMIQYLIRSLPHKPGDIIEIGVAQGNPRALALYERLGFERAYELTLHPAKQAETIIYLRLKIPS